MPKIGIVAALEREIKDLIKDWLKVEHTHDHHRFDFFEHGPAVAVCGGMGSGAARRAAEALMAIYHPDTLISAGFAGALQPSRSVGDVLWPQIIIDASDSSRTEIADGQGSLVSFSEVASPAQKAKLASAFQADAVDMEAAAVARVAAIHGANFAAVKAISDDATFEMPDLSRFITPDGHFRQAAFAAHAALRPQLWPQLIRLARNSAKASRALCTELARYPKENATAEPKRTSVATTN
ncbi:MAG TPA: phosphorylase [Terriglobales bacterium]